MDIFVWLLPCPLLLHCWSWTEKIQQKIMKILKHLPKPPAYNLHFHSRLSPLRCLDPPHRSGSPAWRKSFGVLQTGQEENLTDWYWMIIVEKLYISPDLEQGCRWDTAGRRRPGYISLKYFLVFKKLTEISDHFLPPEEHSLAIATERRNGKILRGRFIMITFTVILWFWSQKTNIIINWPQSRMDKWVHLSTWGYLQKIIIK